jgi:hypothetical protein
MPADIAERAPEFESSKAIHKVGSTSSFRAASRYMSGALVISVNSGRLAEGRV